MQGHGESLMALDNVQEIAAALDAAEAKAGGTLAERGEARQALRDIVASIRNDPQGFRRHLDAVEHAFRAGYVAAGGKGTGPEIAQAFADYEARRRAELGL